MRLCFIVLSALLLFCFHYERAAGEPTTFGDFASFFYHGKDKSRIPKTENNFF
uniref:Uncharacterized protein n=1 Tax=Amphimedon queenslandica TaxID=400682 RepID=A0A1X7SJZ2_AMPQE